MAKRFQTDHQKAHNVHSSHTLLWGADHTRTFPLLPMVRRGKITGDRLLGSSPGVCEARKITRDHLLGSSITCVMW